jgi:hypothetical protein
MKIKIMGHDRRPKNADSDVEHPGIGDDFREGTKPLGDPSKSGRK